MKEVTSRNRANRKKLIPLVEEHIAYQEYCAILEDLDKQVDLSYMKRLKGKGKKRKTDANTPQQQAINSGLRALLEKRKDGLIILVNCSQLLKNEENTK